MRITLKDSSRSLTLRLVCKSFIQKGQTDAWQQTVFTIILSALIGYCDQTGLMYHNFDSNWNFSFGVSFMNVATFQ